MAGSSTAGQGRATANGEHSSLLGTGSIDDDQLSDDSGSSSGETVLSMIDASFVAEEEDWEDWEEPRTAQAGENIHVSAPATVTNGAGGPEDSTVSNLLSSFEEVSLGRVESGEKAGATGAGPGNVRMGDARCAPGPAPTVNTAQKKKKRVTVKKPGERPSVLGISAREEASGQASSAGVQPSNTLGSSLREEKEDKLRSQSFEDRMPAGTKKFLRAISFTVTKTLAWRLETLARKNDLRTSSFSISISPQATTANAAVEEVIVGENQLETHEYVGLAGAFLAAAQEYKPLEKKTRTQVKTVPYEPDEPDEPEELIVNGHAKAHPPRDEYSDSYDSLSGGYSGTNSESEVSGRSDSERRGLENGTADQPSGSKPSKTKVMRHRSKLKKEGSKPMTEGLSARERWKVAGMATRLALRGLPSLEPKPPKRPRQQPPEAEVAPPEPAAAASKPLKQDDSQPKKKRIQRKSVRLSMNPNALIGEKVRNQLQTDPSEQASEKASEKEKKRKEKSKRLSITPAFFMGKKAATQGQSSASAPEKEKKKSKRKSLMEGQAGVDGQSGSSAPVKEKGTSRRMSFLMSEGVTEAAGLVNIATRLAQKTVRKTVNRTRQSIINVLTARPKAGEEEQERLEAPQAEAVK